MTQTLELVVHITHEAGVKVGGIGAVLNGLLAAPAYRRAVPRSIITGALNVANAGEMERLFAPGNGLKCRYSRPLDINTLAPALSQQFRDIEDSYGVRIIYGRRPFAGVEHEVLLLDVSTIDTSRVNLFKYHLWDKYGIDCGRYESDPEFARYVHFAEPAYAALYHLTADIAGARVLLAHEWMGLPFVFAAQMRDARLWRTAFYAHEVATARLLIESHPGHDTRFYNTMQVAQQQGLSLEDVFGNQDDYFKHALIKRAATCDTVLAVGDRVVDELRFLGGALQNTSIDLVYNGIPAGQIDLDTKKRSEALLQDYAQVLIGYEPDFIFSHVTRFVTSKALWRDLRVLQHLDPILAQAGKKAVFFLLSSTEPSGRSPEQIRQWEADYGWPVHHRADNGDLLGLEADFFTQVLAPFNQRSQAVKAVLVNQFGWSRDRCGQRMPAEMRFMDLRQGTDVEFGQSIYEPFGIAQVEPLGFGALCVVSNVCGCVGFVRHASAELPSFPNLIVADYTTPPPDWIFHSPADALRLDQFGRDLIEIRNSQIVAETIATRLALSDDESRELLRRGQQVGCRMSWDVVVTDYLLPALQRAIQGRL